MSLVGFVLGTGYVVFVTSIAALCFSRLFRKDAATRDAILFAAVCLCLCAPLVLFATHLLGFSWRELHPPGINEAHNELNTETFAPAASLEEVVTGLPTSSLDTSSELSIPTGSFAERAPRQSLAFPPVSVLFFCVWSFGAVAFTARMLFAWSQLQRVVYALLPLDDESANRACENAKRMLELKAEAHLRVSKTASVPFVSGLLRSAVILPANWKRLTEKELEDVLIHELMHVARRDSPKLFLQHLVATIYWPIITVHCVNHLLNEAREEVCDNGVLRVRDAISYGETLLKAAHLATLPIPHTALGFMRRKSSLERRVSHLLADDRLRQIRASLSKFLPVAGVLALIVAAGCVLAAPPQQSVEQPTQIGSVVKVEKTQQVVGEVDSEAATLKVRVVDRVGTPISNADVLLYDEHNILARLERRFDNVLMRSNAQGECDFGTLPIEHVAILVRRRKGEFDESVVHLFTRPPIPRLSTNRLVQLETNGNEITVTHTMRQGVDLKFEIIDSVTKVPIHFAGIHWKDPTTEQWSNVALLDSGGQHNGTTLVPEMGKSIFRAARAGYEPAEVLFGRELSTDEATTHRIELKPHPKVKLSILTPNGKPAGEAKVEWSNRDGLANEESLRTGADANGILEVRYPPHPEDAQLKVTHESGTLSIRFADIGPDGQLNLEAKPPPQLTVRVLDQNSDPVNEARVRVGDGDHMLGSREGDFEFLYGTTDESGTVDFGVLPKGFVRIEVLGNGCPQVYAMIGGRSNGQFQQVTPRYFVDVKQTDTELEVIFELTPPTPVRFNMLDADTGEDLFSVARGYPEVFVHIDGKWWILALFDSSGQHNFAPVIKSMEGHTFRAEAPGYKPKLFEVTGLKADGIEHRVELQRLVEQNSPVSTRGRRTKPQP